MNASRTDALRGAAAARAPELRIQGPAIEGLEEVLNPAALKLLSELHRRFEPRRLELLAARRQRQLDLDDGLLPDFLPDTAPIRSVVSLNMGAQLDPS